MTAPSPASTGVTVRLANYVWRPLTASAEDTDFVVALRGSEASRAAFFTTAITRDDHRRFLVRAEERGELNWIVEKDGARVGMAGIYHIDRKNRRAELGRLVAHDPQAHLLTCFVGMFVAFEHMGLHKLTGETLATNDVVNRGWKRLGLIEEGRLREHVLKDGTPHDVVLFGTLESDWLKLKPTLTERLGRPELVRSGSGSQG